MFELRGLECFMMAVEHRNFGRAAEALGMTQPAFSRRIAALERQAGTRLFSRAQRQVELAPAGEIFAREAMIVLAQAESVRRLFGDASNGSKGHLRVGTRSGARFVIIPEAIRRLRSQFPEVSITLGDPLTIFNFDQLYKGVLDIAIVRGAVGTLSGLCCELLRRDALTVVLPEGHRLAGKSAVDVRDLVNESFVEIASHRGYGSQELVRGVYAAAGFRANVVQELETIDMLLMAVAAGTGIAIMYDASCELPIPGIVYRPLRPKQKTVDMHAVFRSSDNNPVLAPFVRHLKDVAAVLDEPMGLTAEQGAARDAG